jgi:ketosteroid isomerase-like protein
VSNDKAHAEGRKEAMNALTGKMFQYLNTGDTTGIDEVIAPGYVSRNAAGAPEACLRPGPAGVVAVVSWLRGAFSDLRFEEMERISEADRCMVRVVMNGRHTGEFQGIPATNRTVSVQQVHIFRFAEGKIVEHRAIRDDMGLARQLGAVPIAGAREAGPAADPSATPSNVIYLHIGEERLAS